MRTIQRVLIPLKLQLNGIYTFSDHLLSSL
jgi:hypothetical protein